MNILITGGCGFLGSNLAAHGINEGHRITVFDNLSRRGASSNLEWLRTQGDFTFVHGDTRVYGDLETIIKSKQFDSVFHVAGQVAMTKSIENPYGDFQTNAQGAIHLLECIRLYSPHTHVIFSSTNKVYGDLEQYDYEETDSRFICKQWAAGFDESLPLDFHSPYGCSKGTADQYMLDYARIFGLKTTVFRHSSMYGGRQFASYDQGWIGWFCRQAIEKTMNLGSEEFTISGNGKQVRDVLHADDMIKLYYSVAESDDTVFGEAYNIGGGMDQSLSLLELFVILEGMTGAKLKYRQLPPRISDQKVFVADISKIKSAIAWMPQVGYREGIQRMLTWTEEQLTNYKHYGF